MPSFWQEHFLEKLVAAAHAADDGRLATAALHRRKKTVGVQHAQVRSIECSFAASKSSGSQAQVLLIECQPKRGTEIDGPVLKREFQDAALGGDVQVDHDVVWFQCQWGHGADAVFPVQDARRVTELTGWANRSLSLLFDHLERRRHVVLPAKTQLVPSQPLDLRVTLEKYLEDLLAEQWHTLPWAADLEYLDRQLECGTLGTLDILARDRSTGAYVVIELKRDQGDDEVVGQVSRYMGWVKQHRADHAGVGVRGIIVAYEATDRLRSAVLPHPNISLYTYQFSVALAPIVATAPDSSGGEHMKTLLLVVVGHIVGIAILLWTGWLLNDLIDQYADRYAGIITVVSTAFGLYSFMVSLLYHRNRRFHFWVNRLRLMFIRTHTYWQPSFDLELSDESFSVRPQLLDRLWTATNGGRFGSARKLAQTPTTLSVEIDDVMCFVFRLADHHLHVHLDRKLLVPSHLYDMYRQKLARLAEEIQRIVTPAEIRYGLIVSFGDGVTNPYYGFFINQVPAELLQDFHVMFRPDAESTSRIEAGKDHVSIEGSRHVDFFEAFSQVLTLRAAPGGIAT